jgi:hypothetical protein
MKVATPALSGFRSILLFLSLSLISSSLFSQQLDVRDLDRFDPGNDTMLISANQMPRIIPLAGLDTLPFYTYTYIFGDGSFTTRRDSLVTHIYDAGKLSELGLINPTTGGGPANPTVSIYFVDSYGGGQEPPGLTIPQDTTLEKDELPSQITRPPSSVSRMVEIQKYYPESLPEQSVVDTGFIRMQANTAGIRPGDTIAFILSFKNRLPDLEIPNGTIHLFYNGRIDKRSEMESRQVVEKSSPGTTPAPEFGQFHFRKDMLYFSNLNRFAKPFPSQTIHFKDVLSYNFFEVFPGEELRVFIEYAVDTIMWEAIQGRETGKVSFFAVMTAAYSPNQPNPPYPNDILDLDNTELALLDSFDTNGFLEEMGAELQSNFQVLDAEYVTFDLVKSHDPNQMTIEACQCPGEGRNTLLCTAQFVNDGSSYTQNVIVDVEIPEELDFGTLEVIGYPEVIDQFADSEFLISTENSTRTYRFEMTNFALRSTQNFGAGHPRTQGQIIFTISTRTNAAVEDVPTMSACITFDKNFEETYCTPPVRPVTSVALDGENASLLDCKACPEAVEPALPSDDILCDWFCKLILLIVALLLIILVIYLRWKQS